MRRSRAAFWALCCGSILAACSNAGGAGGPATPPGSVSPPGASDEQVCPTCRQSAGGQTGDFDASLACALPEEERPITDEIRRTYRLDEVAHAAQVSFTQPLQWGKSHPALDRGGTGAVMLHTSTEQFEPQDATTIDVTIALEPFRYLVSPCGGARVEAPIKMTFSTKDGALAAETRGTLELSGSEIMPAGVEPSVQAGGVASLSDVTGTLDIPIDTSRIQEGEVRFAFAVLPGGVRGGLYVELRDFDDEAAYEAYHTQTDSFSENGVHVRTLIEGQFPIDGCDSESFPIDADTPQALLGGQSAASVVARSQASMGAASMPAQWLDGTTTQIRFDLGSTPSGTMCLTTGNNPTFGFPTTARVTSDDSRVDIMLPRASASMNDAGDVGEIYLATGMHSPVPAGDFAAASGIDNVVAGRHRSLISGIEVYQDWHMGSGSLLGAVVVSDSDTEEHVDCLVWPRPPSGKVDESCNPLPMD
jgi:hypothetical protein